MKVNQLYRMIQEHISAYTFDKSSCVTSLGRPTIIARGAQHTDTCDGIGKYVPFRYKRLEVADGILYDYERGRRAPLWRRGKRLMIFALRQSQTVEGSM